MGSHIDSFDLTEWPWKVKGRHSNLYTSERSSKPLYIIKEYSWDIQYVSTHVDATRSFTWRIPQHCWISLWVTLKAQTEGTHVVMASIWLFIPWQSLTNQCLHVHKTFGSINVLRAGGVLCCPSGFFVVHADVFGVYWSNIINTVYGALYLQYKPGFIKWIWLIIFMGA